MKAVFKKELQQLFHSMIGYTFLVAFSVISGYYFLTVCLLPSHGNVQPYFSSVFSVLMLLIPIITMRSFAEERKARTDQLLLSSPLKPRQIVLGKFLAVFLFFLLSLIPCLFHVAVLAGKGVFEPSLVVSGLTGMILAGAAFLAIGLLISALTENQVVACITTYCTLLLFWLIGYAANYTAAPTLQKILFALSLASRFNSFAMGLLSFSGIAFFVSIAAAAISLNTLAVAFMRD